MTAGGPSTSQRTILVLDDDPDIRHLLKETLEQPERRIVVSADAQEALGHLNRGVVPDLVILDLMLPGMSGMETLDLFRKRYPSLKTIVVSAKDDVDTVVEAMRLGALDFIRKPFDVMAIRVSVNEALQFRELEQRVQQLKRQQSFSDQPPFIYSSPAMAAIMETIQQSAPTNVPILITGDSGVGKEVVAQEVHHRSERAKGPFVKVNCAALPASLLESELFGFEKGAFTGAHKSKPSRFEKAMDGTLFLDEIGELEQGIQAKFLHVLQDGSYTKLGSNKVYRSNARIIVATNRDLEENVGNGRFRADLYYRLNVIRIHVPPLRERRSDIAILAQHFLAANSRKFGKTIELTPGIIDQLMQYSWPGNVRELQNALSRYAVLGKLTLGDGGIYPPRQNQLNAHWSAGAPRPAAPTDVPAGQHPAAGLPSSEGNQAGQEVRSLKEVAREAARGAEKTAILRVLEITRWNKSKAARILKVSYKALLYKIKECGIEDAK